MTNTLLQLPRARDGILKMHFFLSIHQSKSKDVQIYNDIKQKKDTNLINSQFSVEQLID